MISVQHSSEVSVKPSSRGWSTVDPVFHVDASGVNHQALVRFVGELDLAGVKQAQDQVLDVLDQCPRGALILDLADLTYCDSAGIHVLLRLRTETEARGREMILRHLQPWVARILELAGVRDQFTIEDSTANAE